MHPALRQQAFFSFNKANCDGSYPKLFVIFDKIENFSAFFVFFMRRLESLKFSGGNILNAFFLDFGVIIVSADPNDFNSNAQDEEQNT